MTPGPETFARFAYPPNSLGYCGPTDTGLLAELMADPGAPQSDVRHAMEAFAGAWPYLELIGGITGHDPLDAEVVEAYWIGNGLLTKIDPMIWGNSVDDRFRRRAGHDWDRLSDGINAGGVPNHAFHVFCAYPWVGLLRSGAVDQALVVLDRCRIRWGEVVGLVGERALVVAAPLEWDGQALALGEPRVESVAAPADGAAEIAVGDDVAMHWDYVCQRITPRQKAALERVSSVHLDIANRSEPGGRRRLAARIER